MIFVVIFIFLVNGVDISLKKCKHDTVNSFSEDYIPCLYGPLPLKKLFKVRLQSRQLQIHVLNSVQEAYAECFAVHISKFEVLHTS